jgi:hypothetical protein
MDKSFDDLFNEFFKPKSSFDMFSSWMNEANQMFKMFQNPSNNSFNERLEDEMEKALGKPDEVIYYTEKGYYFQKSIWHTKEGDIIKTLMSDDPKFFGDDIKYESFVKPKIKPEVPTESLEVQLQKALDREDYEKAAEIRDLMNPPKKKRGRPKKSEK